MIVVIGIFSLIFGTIMTIYLSGYKIFKQQSALVEIQGQTKLVSSIITNEIKKSDKVVSSRDFAGQTYSSGADTLILELPSIDANQNVISGYYDYEVFLKDPTNPKTILEKREVSVQSTRHAETKIISTMIDAVNYTYDYTTTIEDTNKVTVVVSASNTKYNETQNITFTGAGKLRNK